VIFTDHDRWSRTVRRRKIKTKNAAQAADGKRACFRYEKRERRASFLLASKKLRESYLRNGPKTVVKSTSAFGCFGTNR